MNLVEVGGGEPRRVNRATAMASPRAICMVVEVVRGESHGTG
jgi:hypothetical protein